MTNEKLNVSVIGIGNAGNQIAALAAQEGFSALALNSSISDIETVRDVVNTAVIGDSKGAGKDRTIAKDFMSKTAKELIASDSIKDLVVDKDICVIVSSTGGGTGSGMSPVLQHILSKVYPDTHFIIAGILPTKDEPLATLHNSLGYLEDMLKSNPTYMLYDNEVTSSLNPTEKLTSINSMILEDLKVLRGDYQKETKLNSIDEKDSMKLYRTPGRLVLATAKDLTEGDTLSVLIDAVNSSAHTELDLDNMINRRGLIFNLSEKMYGEMDFSTETLGSEFGEPIEGFEHSHVNSKESDSNIVAVIMSGLSFPTDRLKTIQEQADKLTELIKEREKQQTFTFQNDTMDSLRQQDTPSGEVEPEDVDINDIFDLYK